MASHQTTVPKTKIETRRDDLQPLLAAARELTALLNQETLLESLDSQLRLLFQPFGWQLYQVDKSGISLVKECWQVANSEFSAAARTFAEETWTSGAPQMRVRKGKQAGVAGLGSLLAVPFADNRDQSWVLTLASDNQAPPLERSDQLRAVEFCRFLAIALGNARFVATIQRQNITDDLTGLFNSRHLGELLDYELERARRYGSDLSVVFFDLDYFKQVNDEHGHLVGSRLLHEIGQVIKAHMRRVNLACRYGGDEFVILLPSTPKSGAVIMAEHLRSALGETRFSAGADLGLQVTASFGVAAYPTDATTKEDLVRKADSAMYHVKANGRNGVCAA